jgi:hypothetical protein
MLSVATDGFAKVVELVCHGFVNRFAGTLDVLTEGFGNLVDRHEIHHRFGAVGSPLGSAAPGTAHGGACHPSRFSRERARRALPTPAKHHRDTRAGHDPEDRSGQQIVLIAVTPDPSVSSV